MKRIYSMFTDWEDYQNGMYSNSTENIDILLPKCIELLSNDLLFYNNALKMIFDWPICADYNLTNVSCNRRAWIGQSTCCYVHKASEVITRLAWSDMDSLSKTKANLAANKIIKIYEEKHKQLHQNLGAKMLF